MRVMEADQAKRIGLIALLVIVVIFALTQLFRFASNLFESDNAQVASQIAMSLPDYDNQNSYVRLTYDGSVVARENHRAIRITVTPKQRKIEVLKGYLGAAAIKKTYSNDIESYKTFIRAINYNGFAKSRSSSISDDERGVCSRGTRTITELFNDNQSVFRLWSASCDKKLGTLGGDSGNLLKLFQKQIPDYNELTRGIRLY